MAYDVSRLFLRGLSPLLHHWLPGRAAGGGVAVNLKATNVLAAGVAALLGLRNKRTQKCSEPR